MPSPPVTTACRCGRARTVRVAPTVEMEVDAATLRLDGVAVASCEAGHVELVDDSVADRALAAIDDGLLVANRPRLRRGDRCGDCGATLTLPGRRSDTPVPFASPFGVVTPTVIATMVRCPECGREQLAPDARDALPTLVASCVAEALRLAGQRSG
ncbi:MAG TPA: hypothetical protein VJ978_04320 [Nitriliruptoraceae bacterium]|nr:hypothetical protein [Nitriliruptoraceae bacterium]